MGKQKVGNLYGKPIVTGDKNLQTVNEVFLSEGSGGGNTIRVNLADAVVLEDLKNLNNLDAAGVYLPSNIDTYSITRVELVGHMKLDEFELDDYESKIVAVYYPTVHVPGLFLKDWNALQGIVVKAFSEKNDEYGGYFWNYIKERTFDNRLLLEEFVILKLIDGRVALLSYGGQSPL